MKDYAVITHEPVLGELRYGRELGRNTGQRFIFAACEGCGKTRWVEYRKGQITDKRCIHCVNKGRTFKLTHARTDIEAKVGDIKTGGELGMKFKEQRYIYESCPNCGNNRWVQVQTAGKYSKCRKCINKGKIGEQNGNWAGGKKISTCGYIEVLLYPNDPYIKMAKKSRYVLEHRLVVAKSIGRCLEDYEIVHHKDSIPQNNSIDNLELIGDGKHNTMVEKTIKKNGVRILELERKVLELESELAKRG
jgi:hypothetical protein